MDRETLLRLIEDDDLGLLEIKSSSSNVQSTEERIVDSFKEINDFICEVGYAPRANSNMQEFKLWTRLEFFRKEAEKVKVLLPYDEFGLLTILKEPISSLKDIFEDDDLELLKDSSDDIFNIRHIPKESNLPNYVAQRKRCQNFQDYEHLFKRCQSDLACGKRKLISFAKEQQINEGDFFVLKGVLTYVVSVGKKEINNGKKNARLYCVFENGTESNMLLRSLARELYKDGRRVTVHEDWLLNDLKSVNCDDRETGYIYVLKSLSQRPEIKALENLYKIGFSRIPVEERIKNASKEPTYLMAPVFSIASYKCFNLNPQKFEFFLHKFFDQVRCQMDVFDEEKKRHTPREWFIVPFKIINEAVDLLISRDIIKYKYDHKQQKIIEKE